MPLLGPGDALPSRPRRVLVAGTSGAGKTTLAAAVGGALGLSHVEADALFHGPGWVPRPSFVADVERLVAGEDWVTEWQYDAVRALLASRADLLVWLDLPTSLVVRQLVQRTVVRRWCGYQLWNGNREAPLHTFLTDPEHVVRWAWRTDAATGPRVLALHRQRPELPVVRLRSRRDVDRWSSGPLRSLTGRPRG